MRCLDVDQTLCNMKSILTRLPLILSARLLASSARGVLLLRGHLDLRDLLNRAVHLLTPRPRPLTAADDASMPLCQFRRVDGRVSRVSA